jgi:hypothetical protein
MAENEISVTTEGLTVKGELVSDLRPPVQRVMRIADSVLRLVENGIRLPFDYLSNNLERVRSRYVDHLSEIPIERLQEPLLRLALPIVRHAAESADEPMIQDMFAKLLASASDSDLAPSVHPGFATVISEMRPVEAHVLVALHSVAKHRGIDPEHLRVFGIDPVVVRAAIANLVRLGLVDWQSRTYSDAEIEKLSGNMTIRLNNRDINGLVRDIEKDVRKLKTDLISQVQRQQARRVIAMTAFGLNFVSAVKLDSTDGSGAIEPTS